MRSLLLLGLLPLTLLPWAPGCSAAPEKGTEALGDTGVPADDTGGSGGDTLVADGDLDTGTIDPDGGLDLDGSLDGSTTPPPAAEVWAHSADTLYKLDPDTKKVTVIGNFKGCSSVVDIALDEKSNLYASAGGIYKVDKKTATCTLVGGGSFAGNSLSFVPVGVLDPTKEVMVTYSGSEYMRVDIASGKTTSLGSIAGGYGSSGDIVSVKGGGTYLSAYGPGCSDCLLEVNPKTGAMIKNWGSLGTGGVYGLAFWAGKIYAFDSGGRVFEVTFGASSITTKEIPVSGKPPGLSFWGAGSTTVAPTTPVK